MEDVVRIQMFFTALPLAFGVLHLFLFASMPRLRSDLYYALFLFFIAAAIYLDFQTGIVPPEQELTLLRLHRATLAVSIIFAYRFICEVFLGRAPLSFRYITYGVLVTGFAATISPNELFWPLELFLLIVFVASIVVMIGGIRRRQEDALLIALGYATFLAFAVYDMLLDFGLMRGFEGITNAYQFGLVGLFIASSAYLARGIARTNRQLVEHARISQQHEIDKRILEAEVERTKAELEEARALQLSLLPSAVPDRPDLDLAVHMQTAMEVGGDYYDFRDKDDGVLTIALGDATGHGLRAGIMVAIAKSLFQGLRDDEPLPDFFNRCTRILKPMSLGNLFMAMTLVRVRPEGLTVAAAGMPPVLVYRARRQSVEEIRLRGMPLGAFSNFAYQHAWVPFERGDVVLLVSDGLPEQFDEQREMLGMDRVVKAFLEVAAGTPDEIVHHLREVGRRWMGGGVQTDDVTILAVKAVGEAG